VGKERGETKKGLFDGNQREPIKPINWVSIKRGDVRAMARTSHLRRRQADEHPNQGKGGEGSKDKLDWFKRLTDSVTLLGVVIGFLATYVQLGNLRESSDMAAWNEVSKQWIEIDKFFFQNADLRKYMYKNEPIPETDPNYEKVQAAALYALDFADNVISTAKHLHELHPKNTGIIPPEEWKAYFGKTFFQSKVVCNVIMHMPDGFDKDTQDIAASSCPKG